MNDVTFPQFELVNRRLINAILGLTLLTGMLTCLSYVIYRNPAPAVRAEIRPSPVKVVPAPVQAVEPAAVNLYLQVGLLDPAVDRSMRARLVARGYSVRLAPMKNSTVTRVLVGPISSTAMQRELESKLKADGFQYFPRRY